MKDQYRELEQQGICHCTDTGQAIRQEYPDGWVWHDYYDGPYSGLVSGSRPTTPLPLPTPVVRTWKQRLLGVICWMKSSHLWHYWNPEHICERCGATLKDWE